MPLPAPTADSYYFAMAAITDQATGRWEATVDWAIPTNTLWMWVANGACTVDQFAKPACPLQASCECQFTVRSETAAPKPRVLSIPNAPGGTRTLIVLNLGPREEAVEYSVTLTPTSIVSGGSALVTSTSSTSGGRVSIGRKSGLHIP